MRTILCRIVWADEYKSKKEKVFAGNMSYPAEHNIALERLNFLTEGQFVYGFVENKGDRININNLGANSSADQIDGVTVIWCALDKYTGRLRVVGWYDDARVYREPQVLGVGSVRGSWLFQFKTRAKDAHLIPATERDLSVPMKIRRTDRGFIGERNWFFPEKSPRYQKFLEIFHLMRTGKVVGRNQKFLDQEAFQEGERIAAEVNLSARNPKLVAAAKRHYGYRCQVCDFSFEERYGKLGKGFIEVHHLVQLASGHAPRKSTIKDVRVLCANCHRMVHKETPPLDLEKLARILR